VVTSVLLHPWAIVAVIAAVVAALVIGWWTKRPTSTRSETVWVANAAYIKDLPAYRTQMQLYKMGVGIAVALLIGATVAAGLIASRPVDREEFSEELTSRDIVLCLDVSGSMMGYSEEIVERFLEMLPSFHGERIALSIWNSTSRTVFPLTNDYDMIERELKEAQYALSFDIDSIGPFMDYEHFDRLIDFIHGTYLEDDTSASLIGDGLATCALMFDDVDAERSRSIIFATDNDIQGIPIYELDEAADLVVEKDIMLFGIHAGESAPEQLAEYRDAVQDRDGLFYEASNPELVDGVLDRINESQARTVEDNPTVLEQDSVKTPFGVLMMFSAFYLAFVWWLRS